MTTAATAPAARPTNLLRWIILARSSSLWLGAGLTLLFHAATARGYGYFRDELYYLASAEHLGLGYVDHPPLIGWIAALVRATLGDSLFAIRLLPALAAAATVMLAGAMARRLGGGQLACILAMAAAFLMPIYQGLFSIFSMNAFDVLFWALGSWLLVRLLGGGDPRLWLGFGLVCGIGLENKISLLFFGFGLVVGLVVARRWEVFRSRWLWLGGGLAGLLFLPHLLWQVTNDWPTLEFMENARRYKNVDFSPGEFLGQQALLLGPLPLAVALAGLGFLLLDPRARPWRALGWAFPAIVVLMLAAGGAKPYYLAPVYTLLLAAGGAALELWTAPRRAIRTASLAFLGLLALLSLALIPLAKPVLPVETYVEYSRWLGIEGKAEERHEMGRLPQFFADMHGWPELAATVAGVFHALPPEEQARACVFGQNYGQAGAIDVLGRPLGLPPALSGHNSYFLWGPGMCTGEVSIIIGDDRETLETIFASVEQAAVSDCTDCMPYEDELPIWVARGMRVPIAELWPQVKHYE